MNSKTPRTKPFFISPYCDACQNPLKPADFIPIDLSLSHVVEHLPVINHDEWSCFHKDCASFGSVILDLPEDELERLSGTYDDQNLIPFKEVAHLFVLEEEDFRLMENVKDPSFVVKISRIFFEKEKLRGDC